MGCAGMVGVGAVAALGLLAVVAGGVWWLGTQWEATLRAAIVTPTGGEVDFESVRPSFGGVTVTGLVVRAADGEPVLEADALVATGNPWSWTTTHVGLDAAELRGLKLVLRREGDAWALPTTTLDLLAGRAQGASLPELTVPRLVVTDGVIEVRAPEGAFDVRVDAGMLTALRAVPGASLEVGGASASTLAFAVGDDDELVLTGLSAKTALQGTTSLALSDIRVASLEGTVGRGGWTLPEKLVGTLSGGEGIAWPAIAVSGAKVGETTLRARAGGARLRTGEVEVGDAAVHLGTGLEVSVPGTVKVGGVRLVGADGAELASTPWASLRLEPWGAESGRVRVASLSTGLVTATLQKDPTLGVPEATYALLRAGGQGPVRVGHASLESTALTLSTGTGPLRIETGAVEASDITAPARLAVGSATIRGARVDDSGTTFARGDTVTFGADGRLAVSGGEVWTEVRADRTLALPAGVKDHAPTWLGGVSTSDGAPWFGVSFTEAPWRPQRMTATGVVVHLRDGALVQPAVDWTMRLERLDLGPIAGDVLPISGVLAVADGTADLQGRLRVGGALRLQVDGKGMSAVAFEPYAAKTLDDLGVDLVGGVVKSDLLVRLVGSELDLTGDAKLKKVALDGRNATGKVLAQAAGRVASIDVEVDVHGDLTDPEFSPVKQVIGAVVRGAVSSVKGDAVAGVAGSEAAAGVRNTAGKAEDRAKDEAEKVKGAIDDLGSKLGIGKGGKAKAKAK